MAAKWRHAQSRARFFDEVVCMLVRDREWAGARSTWTISAYSGLSCVSGVEAIFPAVDIPRSSEPYAASALIP
eukprot:12927261-Prorocentrum_lima.AAC.1